MALASDFMPPRKGQRVCHFGAPIAPGEVVYAGSIVGLNAAFQLQRAQTAGTVALLGLASKRYNNSASANAGPNIEVEQGLWGMVVPGVTAANLRANVYAVDDGTVTLTQNAGSTLLLIGTIAGFENGVTYVRIKEF